MTHAIRARQPGPFALQLRNVGLADTAAATQDPGSAYSASPKPQQRVRPMRSSIAPPPVPVPYWRAALAEVSLLHPQVAPESKAIGIERTGDRWHVGHAHPDGPTWVSAQFAASKARPAGQSARTIPFVLIAARLSEAASHGVKRDAAGIHRGPSVLCIPCLLDRSGGLWPDPDRWPSSTGRRTCSTWRSRGRRTVSS